MAFNFYTIAHSLDKQIERDRDRKKPDENASVFDRTQSEMEKAKYRRRRKTHFIAFGPNEMNDFFFPSIDQKITKFLS